MTEKTDITERATAAGWNLPYGWKVLAWTEHDGSVTDPRNEGDVYKTDVEEKDYNHPTRAFCKHCGEWIRELDDDGADKINGAHEEQDAVAGTWASRDDVIICSDRATSWEHEPDVPVAVRWWREDRWEFVGVLVEVVDQNGRMWGEDQLWGTESGTFPYVIDKETGDIKSLEIDPLTAKHHPLPEMIDEALGSAREALEIYNAAAPTITRKEKV